MGMGDARELGLGKAEVTGLNTAGGATEVCIGGTRGGEEFESIRGTAGVLPRDVNSELCSALDPSRRIGVIVDFLVASS